MSGFAFASIYKDPTPAPGPGPGPTPAPTPGPEPEPPVTYTISGESIMPFVPFTVTVTGSSNKAEGDGGNLQADINYEILDGGSWSGGKCEWELGTRVCDSKRTNAKFSWLIRGKDPVTATLAYDAGTMTPDITDASIVLGKTFGFTIAFSGGEDCYATRFADFGASYWWEAFKNGKWEKTTRIVVRQSSFSKGVLSGTGYVDNLAGYEKVRLCVDYAGRDTVYDEAALTVSEVTITLGDDTLHCWGASTSLKIESDSLASMTAAFYRSGDITEDITDTNGTPIAFNFSGTSWTGNIQAATGATAGNVVLKVMYNGVVQASATVAIETEFLADISVSAGTVLQGNTFDMNGAIASTLGSLDRIPADKFSLVAVQGSSQLASISNTAGSQEVEYEGVTPSTLDTVYVRIIDNRDGSIVAEAEVEVQSIKSALAAAINERVLANTGTAGTYTESDTASTLRSAAISAINGYAKGSIAADGTFTAFDNSNHEITTAADTTEWYAATYAIVKSAVSKTISLTVYEDSVGYKTSGRIEGQHTGSGTQSDPYVVETPEHLKQRAVNKCNEKDWDHTDSGNINSFGGANKSYTHYDGSVQDGTIVSEGDATVSIYYWVRRYSVIPKVGGTIDLYFQSSSTNIATYDTFGHNAPATANTKAKCGSFAVTANIQNTSPWFGTSNGEQMEASTSQPSGRSGYLMDLSKAIIHYNFTHK